MVPVADCGKEDFNSHCKTEMKMSDYLEYWRNCMEGEGGSGSTGRDLLYLKDWHFVK